MESKEPIEVQIQNQEAHLETIKANTRAANEILSGIFSQIEGAKEDLKESIEEVKLSRNNVAKLRNLMETELDSISTAREGLAKERQDLARDKAEHQESLGLLQRTKESTERELNGVLHELNEAQEKLKDIPSELDGLDAIREERVKVEEEVNRLSRLIDSANEKLASIQKEEIAQAEVFDKTQSLRKQNLDEIESEIQKKTKALESHGDGVRLYEAKLKKWDTDLRILQARLKKAYKEKFGVDINIE